MDLEGQVAKDKPDRLRELLSPSTLDRYEARAVGLAERERHRNTPGQ